MTRAYLFLCLTLALSGCFGPFKGLPGAGRRDATPKDFFTDAKTVKFCEYIKQGKPESIAQAIKDGADVNAIGKSNVTPLFWAAIECPEVQRKEMIHKLLLLGADPNVVTTHENSRLRTGLFDTSVAHLATESTDGALFDVVFAHGGNANLWPRFRKTPLHELATLNLPLDEKKRRLMTMLEKGGHIDSRNMQNGGSTPAMEAIRHGYVQFALLIFRLGADPTLRDVSNTNACGVLLQKMLFAGSSAPGEKPPVIKSLKQVQELKSKKFARTREDALAVDSLIEWLESHGQSMDQAESELLDKYHKTELSELMATSYEAELKAKFAERDKIAREVWQKALAEDRAKEAAEGKGAEEAADARK